MISIIEGWSKKLLKDMGYLIPPKFALDRVKVCNGCDQNVKAVCQMCGCYLDAKTLVKRENCDLNKWELL